MCINLLAVNQLLETLVQDFASEFLENLKGMYPRYYMNSDSV